MNKYVLIVLSVIILAVFAGVGFFLYNKRVQPEVVNQAGITMEECSAKGGEIINILGDKRAEDLEFRRDHKADFCINKADYLGDVVDLRCPCICCKKPTSSGFSHYQVEKAIMDYLLTQEYFSWKTTTDSRNFCVIENLNPTEEGLFPLYVWVRCGEFILQNGKLKELSGVSVPTKIDYPNELSFYDMSKMSHEAPRDGLLYSKDIKTIFPLNVQNRIADFDSKNINSRIEAITVDWFREVTGPIEALGQVKIKADRDTYTTLMSSTVGIGLTPIYTLGRHPETIRFRWHTNYGHFVSWGSPDLKVNELGSEVINSGEKIYWSYDANEWDVEKPSVQIFLRIEDAQSGQILAESILEINWEDRNIAKVKK
ncbi:MAG: hypothetical protein Athens101410_348 [Parcubacteria group bacterium Athens1014_10]|nr:MAG: hypothetical protein Athens101410_348 [Parcubacteria group bacterium Athens1014_10]TSD05164.1 MAG: hypothetical protein Athens071412_466 [Parcubacteria group bacterium Athens0714_12]